MIRRLGPVVSLLLFAPPLLAAEEGRWLPLPADTATLILATGGDSGYIEPQGCQGRSGGALFRPAFASWLRTAEPGARPFWVSTGNLVYPSAGVLTSLPEMVAFYATVPYAAAAVGRFELDAAGAEGVVEAARIAPFPLLAANLRVLETGRPLVDEAAVFDTPSGRIAFIGVIHHDLTAAWSGPRTGTVVTVDPRVVVPEIVARFKADGARVVLLSNAGAADLSDLLRATPGVDAVLASDGSAVGINEGTGAAPPTLWLGMLGQQLGRLAFDRAGRLLEARTQPVSGEFPVDPLTGQPVAAGAEAGTER